MTAPDLSTREKLLAHLDALAAQTWPDVRDCERTPGGWRCCDCAKTMRAWGRGYVCGCGRAIDAKGNEQ
jgi:hypothetical protein